MKPYLNIPPDEFAQTSRKIAILLNLNPEDKILLVGKRACAWEKDFRSYFNDCHTIAKLDCFDYGDPGLAQKYQLVIWDLCYKEAGNKLLGNLLKVMSITDSQASFILMASNRFSLRINLRRPVNIIRSPFYGSKGYQLLLKKAGFEKTMEFLPLPSLNNMEEIVESRIGDIQLPSYFHIIIRLLNRAGVYRYFHDHYFYIASKSSGCIDRVTNAVQEHLSKQTKLNCRIERFDLRQRGALILMFYDNVSHQRFVARVASSQTIDKIISKNALWVKKIRSYPGMSEVVKAKVPQLFGNFRYKESTFYIEELLNGTLAWKQAGYLRLQPIIFRQVYNFIYEFNISTKKYQKITDRLFFKLIHENDADVSWSTSVPFQNRINSITGYLKENLMDSEHYIVWAHGDFGYGNVIIEPGKGKLMGVIDWDTGNETELAGIDLLNLLIQKYIIEKSCSSINALNNTGETFLEKGFSGLINNTDYDHLFMINQKDRLTLMSLFCLRKFFRLARQPTVFEQNYDILLNDLNWITKKISS